MPKKLNSILFINQSLGIGGAETFNLESLGWLKNQNIRIYAFVSHPRFLHLLKDTGIDAHRVPFIADIIGNWKGLVKSFLTLPLLSFCYWSILIKFRHVDCIIMTGFVEKIIITPFARILNIPVVWWEFSSLNPVFIKFFHLPRFLYSLVEKLPSVVIVPSSASLASLKSETHIPSNRLVLLPIARDIVSPSVKAVPQRIVCVSRLEYGKGQDLLLTAFSQVAHDFPHSSLVIVGEGDFLVHLSHLASNLGISSQVKFTGWAKSALAEIAAGSIFVFPSIWQLEGYGISVLEAMALGKPIIAFPVGAVTDLLTSKTGLILPLGDITALTDSLRLLLSHPSLGKSLGRAAAMRYRRYFTYSVLGHKYLAIIKSCL